MIPEPRAEAANIVQAQVCPRLGWNQAEGGPALWLDCEAGRWPKPGHRQISILRVPPSWYAIRGGDYGLGLDGT